MVRRGQVTRVHELSPDGLTWKKAEEFKEFFGKASSGRVAASQADAGAALDLHVENAAPATPQWHVHCDGQEYGPIDESVLVDWIRQGRVRGDNMVWRQGMADWLPAETAQPSWFVVQALPTGTNPRSTQSSNSSAVSELDANWVVETVSKLSWLYFLAISVIILAVLTTIGGGVFFIRGIAIMRESRAVGTNLLVGGIGSMVYAGMMLISGILLLRYTNSVSALRSVPTTNNALITARRLSLFWFVTSLFMILLIGFVAFGVIVEILADVST